MASKLVTKRQKSAESVAAVGETHADAIGAALSDLLASHLQAGETMPDMALAVRLLSRILLAGKARMVAADEVNEAELIEDTLARTARDQTATSLYNTLISLRRALSGLYGEDLASTIVSSNLSRDPVVLARVAKEVITALGAADLSRPLVPGAVLPAEPIVAELTSLRARLDGEISLVARESRKTQRATDDKRIAIGEYDDVFTGAASILTGAFILNGKKELATRVRPSRSRPGRTESDSGDAADAGLPEPGQDAPGESPPSAR